MLFARDCLSQTVHRTSARLSWLVSWFIHPCPRVAEGQLIAFGHSSGCSRLLSGAGFAKVNCDVLCVFAGPHRLKFRAAFAAQMPFGEVGWLRDASGREARAQQPVRFG